MATSSCRRPSLNVIASFNSVLWKLPEVESEPAAERAGEPVFAEDLPVHTSFGQSIGIEEQRLPGLHFDTVHCARPIQEDSERHVVLARGLHAAVEVADEEIGVTGGAVPER